MSGSVPRREVGYALLAGFAGVICSFAAAGNTRQFVVAPIDAFVVGVTPGEIVAWLIVNVGEEAHLLHIALATAIAVGLLAGVAVLGILATRRLDRPFVGAGLAGVLAWGVAAAITDGPLLAVAVAVPVALFTATGTVSVSSPGFDPSRRRVLGTAASVFGLVGVAGGLVRLAPDEDTGPEGTNLETVETSDEVQPLLDQAEKRSLDVAGTVPGLVSPYEEFYNTDIAQFDPDLAAENWSMAITGEVETGRTVTFDDLTDMPTEHRFVTLRCVGERLNGPKLDNAVWTGTPIKPLLDEVDPDSACACVVLRAADDYFVQFPLAALEEGFLAWGMNGKPLPRSHGHPVRALIPGHWGEVNVKWLSEIELLDEEMDGYWEQRGWHGTGPVNTVAKLWDDTRLEDGRVEVAGHAYAGTRGVERVNVSIDGGGTWHDAELSDPLPGEDVWRQWRYVFEPDGTHEVVVRAVDGDGNLQPEERADPFPSGATGWVRQTIRE